MSQKKFEAFHIIDNKLLESANPFVLYNAQRKSFKLFLYVFPYVCQYVECRYM